MVLLEVVDAAGSDVDPYLALDTLVDAPFFRLEESSGSGNSGEGGGSRGQVSAANAWLSSVGCTDVLAR